MSIILSENTENLINKKITSGLYNSADDLVCEALSLLDKQEAYKYYINSALEEAENSFEKGEFYTEEQVKNHMSLVRENFLNSQNL
ncbi:MAG: type II toxin-antitoxin system ParD family antitoxin [Rickettsiales bacterium]|nr:type II toxin-antitoxin system ParD family antitoxin [Rickettsiales bacterium]